jgi:hypothetical protein
MGNFSGYVVLDDSDKKQYEHNIPLGARTFEVYSAAGKRQYGLNQSPEHPIVWGNLVQFSCGVCAIIPAI